MKIMNWLKLFISRKLNICSPVDMDGMEKEPSILYDVWAFLFLPISISEEPCWCCAGLRGFIYGTIFGGLLACIVGWLL